jgi:hypothetical protein
MRPTAIILGSIAFAVSVIAADFTGTWKLSLSKSKLTSDLVSETMKIEETARIPTAQPFESRGKRSIK